MDDLRYALRKVPRIDVEMTYDEVSLGISASGRGAPWTTPS